MMSEHTPKKWQCPVLSLDGDLDLIDDLLQRHHQAPNTLVGYPKIINMISKLYDRGGMGERRHTIAMSGLRQTSTKRRLDDGFQPGFNSFLRREPHADGVIDN